MADYYNTTSSPLAISLRGGNSMSVGPKSWTYISPADEGTSSLQVAIRKGFLVRAAVPRTKEAVDAVSVSIPAPVSVSLPLALKELTTAEVKVVEKKEEIVEPIVEKTEPAPNANLESQRSSRKRHQQQQ